jgi:hypothetical protein
MGVRSSTYYSRSKHGTAVAKHATMCSFLMYITVMKEQRWRSQLDGQGFKSWQGENIFLYSKTSGPALGPIQPLFSGCSGSSPGIKRPGRDVDHSPPSRTEVKNEWSFTSTTPVCLRTTLTFNLFISCRRQKCTHIALVVTQWCSTIAIYLPGAL